MEAFHGADRRNGFGEKMNSLVAIIIVNWNGKQVTSECLQSLRAVDYSSFNVYVVDNASSDGSVDEIARSFPEVRLIQSTENRFYAGGNNYGFQIAKQDKPEFVLFLNNDTVVDKDFLKYLVGAISSDEKIGMVGPKIFHFDQPDVIWSAGGFVSFFQGKTGHYGLRRKDSSRLDQQREVSYLTGCTQLIRTELFEKLGGFDESYHMYSEDADLCQRARNAGYKIIYIPQSKIWHKISSSSGGGLTAYKIRNKIRGNLRFFRKYARWYHWLTIPIFVFLDGIGFIAKSLVTLNLKNVWRLIKGVAGIHKSEQAK